MGMVADDARQESDRHYRERVAPASYAVFVVNPASSPPEIRRVHLQSSRLSSLRRTSLKSVVAIICFNVAEWGVSPFSVPEPGFIAEPILFIVLSLVSVFTKRSKLSAFALCQHRSGSAAKWHFKYILNFKKLMNKNDETRQVLNLPAGYFGMVLGIIGMGFAAYASALWPVTRWPGEGLVALAVVCWFY